MQDQKTIVVVSGIPRSGTSLMMSILGQAGIPLLTDDARAPDENQTLSGPTPPLSEDAYNFSQLPPAIFGFDSDTRDSDATVDLNDATPLIHQAPWLKPGEPKVVPGLLDGEHALTLRLAAIVGIAFGILAAGVLTAVSATMISEAFEGHAAVPVDEHGFS